MKFTELKRRYKETENFDKCDIQVTEYIPIASKCDSITDAMLDKIVEVKDNFMTTHNFNYKLFTMNLIAKFYCNIDFDGGITNEDYDFLYQREFKLWLKRATKGDSSLFISDFFNRELDNKINRFNSFVNVISSADKRGLLEVGELDEAIAKLKDIDPENMKVLEMMQKENKKAGE